MSKQDGRQTSSLQRPVTSDSVAWKAYWKAQDQSWRTEPEIDAKRQEELAQCRALIPNIEKGSYPFKGMKLSRADIEWLLATHRNGRGPINWSDKRQRTHEGIDLRGADLRRVDLRGLPLARTIAGCERQRSITGEQFVAARIDLEGANLDQAHLEDANLNAANLRETNLNGTHLEGARLILAVLEGATLHGAHLEGGALNGAHLEGATLYGAHLEGAALYDAHLEGAFLNEAFFDSVTVLNDIALSNSKYGSISLVDIHWGDVNVAVVDWSALSVLGDERLALITYKKEVDAQEHLDDYRRAVRAYRQLATVLRNQGLNEEAARFAYRAQMLQRKVFWYQAIDKVVEYDDDNSSLLHQIITRLQFRIRKFGQYLFSLFLDLLAGYGYKPARSFLAYLFVIIVFATAYSVIGYIVGPTLTPVGAFVFSVTSFHGRGFFPGNNIQLDDPLTVVAAFEAFVGLLIEVTFIATLTQRLFGK